VPRAEQVHVPLAGLMLVDARTDDTVDLGGLAGVHVMVLMRHRH